MVGLPQRLAVGSDLFEGACGISTHCCNAESMHWDVPVSLVRGLWLVQGDGTRGADVFWEGAACAGGGNGCTQSAFAAMHAMKPRC
jgi:hypothetical protein